MMLVSICFYFKKQSYEIIVNYENINKHYACEDCSIPHEKKGNQHSVPIPFLQ